MAQLNIQSLAFTLDIVYVKIYSKYGTRQSVDLYI